MEREVLKIVKDLFFQVLKFLKINFGWKGFFFKYLYFFNCVVNIQNII